MVLLLAAALVGGTVGVGPALLATDKADQGSTAGPVRYSTQLSGCSVIDGDTIRCDGERIRLLGIDAPELPGHCRSGRQCVPGDPYASTASLEAGLSGELTIERVGEDHYGRTLALVASVKGDLSCWQLEQHQVIFKAKWDNGLRVARTCPMLVW